MAHDHDAFISFSNKDESTALAVCEALEAKGIVCWFAPRDILPTMDWADAIAEAIDSSRILIVVFSSHSNQSQYVKQEVGLAVDGGIPITQFRIDATKPSGAMKFHLASRHWLDASTPPLETHLDRLARNVHQLFPEIGARPAPAIIVPAPLLTPGLGLRPDGLPNIAWRNVPDGEFLYGYKNEKNRLPAFRISKYPVTYEQFQAFLDAPDGYENTHWWEGLHPDGLKKQQDGPGEQRFKFANHPRERVSWYDTMAFCKWLSSKPGFEGVTLPTELQWEKAARGPEGLVYPYGNEFDAEKCNTAESGIKQSTPVDKYPEGVSPYGVMDMSGNVWEWMLTEYESRDNTNISSICRRVLCGGSWYDNQYLANARYRCVDHYYLVSRSSGVGVRLVAPAIS